MTISITDWNINPNRNWYVSISDSGSGILVELYTTPGLTALVASGSGEYGADVQIVLEMDDAGTPEISVFNADIEYHLGVTCLSGDPAKTYHVAPFVDLEEINDGIYKSTELTQARARYEINLHTHVAKERTLDLAGPYPDVLVGGVLAIDSAARGIDVLTTVTETAIIGTVDSLTTQVTTREYVDLTYNG